MKTLDPTNLLTLFANTIANSNPTQSVTTTQGCIHTTTMHNTPTYDDDFDDFDTNFITLQNALINEIHKQGLGANITKLGCSDQILITAHDTYPSEQGLENIGETYAHILLTFWDGELAITITNYEI